jgi:hypothetical protein
VKYIELSFDREIDLMIKYQVYAEELLFIKLVFLAQEGHVEYLSKYFSQMPLKGAPRDTMLSLQEKGVINKSYKIPEKGQTFNPLDIEFNKNFMKSYLQHSYDMGMELFMKYPNFIIINSKQFSLKNIAKVFKSIDDFAFAYGKAIQFNIDKHNEILELLDWAKEVNILNYGIVEFITSLKWNEIKELKDSGLTTFNTSELL